MQSMKKSIRIYFPENAHKDHIAEHQSLQNSFQNGIYWMSEVEFRFHWSV